MIYGIKTGEREIFLKEDETTGALTFTERTTLRKVGVLEVYGQKVEIGIAGEPLPAESSRNYLLVIKLARVVGLLRGGFPIEGTLEVRELTRRELLLAGEVLRRLTGEREVLNFALEGLMSTFEGERNPYFEELLRGRDRNETLRELLKEGYLARVVGVRFGEVDQVEEGARLFIVREHQNEKDPNAVKVLYKDGRRLGYLRRSLAEVVAPILDGGTFLTGEVRGVGEEVVALLREVE